MVKIAEIDREAEDLLPPTSPDGSRIGVNYADRVLKSLNVTLEDGRKVSAKRKGLKVLLEVGGGKGEAVMRRLEHGPDPRTILRKALEEAAQAAGVRLVIEDRVVYLEESVCEQ